MPLFGGKRDISLFRVINRELLNKIIRTDVDILKVSLADTDVNIYGEAEKKIYMTPARCSCLIDFPELENIYNEGIMNIKQNPIFSFLRDDLVLRNLVIEAGDVVIWNNNYWEIDRIDDSKTFMTRNPDTNKTIGSDWGWNYAVKSYTHMTRKSRINIDRTRSGGNTKI